MQRRDTPLSANAKKRRRFKIRVGRLQAELVHDRQNILRADMFRQQTKIRVTGNGNSRDDIQFSVRTALPATRGETSALVRWVRKVMRLRVRESGKGFDERTEWN